LLSSGSRVGPYEILAPLGAGGMGEVALAEGVTDTTHTGSRAGDGWNGSCGTA
jgi:hypothetical protein